MANVGGGCGIDAIEAVRRYPHLQAVVFDLPVVLETAREKMAGAGYTGRIGTGAGDFFTGEQPQHADVMLLSMILRAWTPEKSRAIV